jgi:hypothetical protein
MKILYKIIIILMVLLFTFIIISFVLNVYIGLADLRWLRSVIRILILAGLAWFVWTKLSSTHEKYLQKITIVGLVSGLLCFAVGFFGPIIFTPEANQGPLLGIFITGTLGFILGTIGGLIYWNAKSRKIKKNDSNKNEAEI